MYLFYLGCLRLDVNDCFDRYLVYCFFDLFYLYLMEVNDNM